MEKENLMTAPALSQHAEEEAKRKVLTVKKGTHVRIVKGRKVPLGTEGEVFWIGGGHYGTRIGLKDAQGTAHWTALSNAAVLLDGDLPPTDPHEHFWRQTLAQQEEAAKKKYAAVPVKGSKVTIVESGVTGEVFWVKGERLGVRIGPNRNDVAWVNAQEVVDANAPAGLPPTVIPEIPYTPPPEGTDHFKSVIALDQKIQSLPHPYGLINYLERVEGVWEGRDASDNTLLRLTENGAMRLITDFAVS